MVFSNGLNRWLPEAPKHFTVFFTLFIGFCSLRIFKCDHLFSEKRYFSIRSANCVLWRERVLARATAHQVSEAKKENDWKNSKTNEQRYVYTHKQTRDPIGFEQKAASDRNNWGREKKRQYLIHQRTDTHQKVVREDKLNHYNRYTQTYTRRLCIASTVAQHKWLLPGSQFYICYLRWTSEVFIANRIYTTHFMRCLWVVFYFIE